MIVRTLTLAGGLLTAGLTSQAPEFTQQYLQRLAGQVDALSLVARDFDASALASGLGREEALSQMTGTDFLTARQADMRRTFARHARLADHLASLRAATPLERLAMPHRLADTDLARATWSDFKPALPLTTAGAVAGSAGFVAGAALTAALLSLLAGLVRRTRRPAPPQRREPTFTTR